MKGGVKKEVGLRKGEVDLGEAETLAEWKKP